MARPHLHILIEPGSLAKYYSADCLAELEAVYEVSCEPAGGLTAEQVSERLVASGAAVAMTGWGAPGLTAGNYAAAPRLRLVAHFGGSVAMLSVTEGWQRGVTFINCAAGMVDAMAEATVGMMLAVGYQFPVTDRRLRGQGDFGHGYPLSYGLKGKRVGIFGLGHIGRRVAELLSAFKVERL
ncbi:MAG: hypothetical protein HUU35_20365, partial [Armatimonadetes bacterium]|nr:hypothetical protein [Armatimonadota bacterium]